MSDTPQEAPTETAPAEESLLTIPAETITTETPADAFTFAEKVMVKAADGNPDWEQTARKAEQARQHLEKRMGSGDAPPKDVAGYEFQMPDDMKDFSLKDERLNEFKAEALKHGINAEQFKWMMGSYLKAVPDLMEGAAKMTASQARDALGQVWTKPDEFTAGLSAAQTAMKALPADLQEAAKGYGTDPVVIRIMSWMGAQMREDTPPSSTTPPAGMDSIQSLQASEAYRNPRHPEHARVSAQVSEFFRKQPGLNQPI